MSSSACYTPRLRDMQRLWKYANASRQPPFQPCLVCQRQISSTSLRRAASLEPSSSAVNEKDPRSPEWRHQRFEDGELIPKPLSRPLGLPHPPQPGQNTGKDLRTFRQRRDDLASYEKHQERQKQIVSDMLEKNYYRDIGNLGRMHRGKSILAPNTPFKASLALYFPNLTGASLEGGGVWGVQVRDTTPVIRGKLSIISMVHTTWASNQTETFISKKDNPELHELMDNYPAARDLAQFVTVNVEENWLKAWMIKMSWRRIRRLFPREQHATYFLNRRGITDEIRDALGMWNSKVGYVYLVDAQCRVRWAGNGDSREGERTSLVTCVRRLLDEARGTQRMRIERQEPRPTQDSRQRIPEKEVALTS